VNALDRELWLTTFPDEFARTRHSEFISLRNLRQRILDTTAPTKEQLPFLKLASFGSRRTGKGCLRNDHNLREVFGCELDYDAKQLTPEQLADALRQHRLAGLVYTSPRHLDDAPRARLLLPFSTPLKPDQRPRMVSRVAGIIPGPITAESWTASQSYFFGRVGEAPQHRVLLVDGDYLDLRADLDATACGKPPPARKATPPRRPRPLKSKPVQSDDAADNEAAPLDIAEALTAIAAGKSSHAALVALAGKFASQAVPLATAQAIITSALDQRPSAGRDEGWQKMRGDVGRTLRWARDKFAESEALLASAPRAHGRGNGSSPPPPPPGGGPGTSPGTPPPQRGAGGTMPRGLMRNRSPRYMGNIANVITALLQDPVLIGCVGFDEMALSICLQQPVPGDLRFTKSRAWSDDDTGRLQDYLQRTAQMGRLGRETVQQGVEVVAHMHPFHPVRDFLEGSVWDGRPRISAWLTRYLGVIDSEYARITGRMWLIGMVARPMQPGCKFDHLLILEGPQGVLKSTVAHALCDPWVSDQSLDIRGDARAASQHLRGIWLHELSELVFFRPADVEAIKAFLTRTQEKYLPRYGRNEVIEPRQCGFIGSTNQQVYLHDPTGNRRFWPQAVGTIDIPALARDRDQLWAEAVVAFRAGEPWWPDAHTEAAIIAPEQTARYAADAWAELIERELENIKKAAASKAAVPRTTLMQIWQAALSDANGPPSAQRFDRPAQIRVREILQFLGWQRAEKSNGAWWWEWRP
jgi:predicted P-loop ATPase